MSRPRYEDRSVPVATAPSRFCPRKLKPDGPNCKRYMSKGPLFGYMIACPSCGFTEMKEHARYLFTEEETGVPACLKDGALCECTEPCSSTHAPIALVSAANPMSCMVCGRTITVVDRAITATL